MPTYIALLRGVNVGGRKLSMDALRTLFGDLGHTAVRTYIQSGNVVFDARPRRASDLRPAIEAGIRSELGLDVTVVLRTPEELASVLAPTPTARTPT